MFRRSVKGRAQGSAVLAVIGFVTALAGCSSAGSSSVTSTTSSSSSRQTATTSASSVIPSQALTGLEVAFGPAPRGGPVAPSTWSLAASAAQSASSVAGVHVETWLTGPGLEVLFLGTPPVSARNTVEHAVFEAGVGSGGIVPLTNETFRIVSGVASAADLPAPGQSGAVAFAAIESAANASKLGVSIAPELAASGLNQIIVVELGLASSTQVEVIGLGPGSSNAMLSLRQAVAKSVSAPVNDVAVEAFSVPTTTSTLPLNKRLDASANFSDTSNYKWSFSVTFAAGTAYSNPATAPPGSTDVVLPGSATVTITNTTTGHDADPANDFPDLSVGGAWRQGSLVCRYYDALATFEVLSGPLAGQYCFVLSVEASQPALPMSLPSGTPYQLAMSRSSASINQSQVTEAEAPALITALNAGPVFWAFGIGNSSVSSPRCILTAFLASFTYGTDTLIATNQPGGVPTCRPTGSSVS